MIIPFSKVIITTRGISLHRVCLGFDHNLLLQPSCAPTDSGKRMSSKPTIKMNNMIKSKRKIATDKGNENIATPQFSIHTSNAHETVFDLSKVGSTSGTPRVVTYPCRKPKLGSRTGATTTTVRTLADPLRTRLMSMCLSFASTGFATNLGIPVRTIDFTTTTTMKLCVSSTKRFP